MSLAQTIVTQGYLYASILTLALWMAVKTSAVLPIPLREEARVNPVVVLNVERMLAMALGIGLFVVAMTLVWPSLFPAGPEFHSTMMSVVP